MAIVQVSRITNRKGLTENLPQLAGAELGWCVDTRRLFIGNGTLQEGAPIIGNTEILTEFSDVLELAEYTYEDIAVGYPAQTGPTPSDPIVRTVQAKLDDFASIRDFGAVGDGTTDDTAAINRALFQLYCVQSNSQVRRSLYFPAGTYRVTDTVLIPAYAKLVGEGADCSIILLDSDDSAVPSYVARTTDSLQQFGVNIATNGATPPRNIEISSMTFRTADITDVFLVEDAQQCYFDSVNFQGPLTQSSILSGLAGDDIAGVRFDSTASLICNQITFDKCRFLGLSYAIKTDEQINSITVSNGNFNTLYQGIVLGTGTLINGGPTGFRAIGNMFDNIYAQGIVYDKASLNATAYNVFYNVGNEFGNSPTGPIVTFGNDNNVSISDQFERSDAFANQYPRVEITNNSAVVGGSQVQLGRYTRENGRTTNLANAVTDQPILTFSSSLIKAASVDYTIIRDAVVRHGKIVIVSGSGDSAVDLQYSDDYTQAADTGITLSAAETGGIVSLLYTSTNTGSTGTMTYSLTHLA
jgi:hypothetical protein